MKGWEPEGAGSDGNEVQRRVPTRGGAALYRETGKSYREVASDLGVSRYSIRRWVIEAGGATGDGMGSPSPVAREETSKLRREVQVLREEREISRNAAAFFATESCPNRS